MTVTVKCSDGAIDQLSLESGNITQSESSANCSTGDSTYKLNATARTTRDKRISNLETLAHLVKGNVGTGIFAMPSAMKHSGLWVGGVVLLLVASICIHCMQMLVNCSEELQSRQVNFSTSYADVAEAACRNGAKQLRKYGRAARITIDTFTCIVQIGFCCVYIVFIGDNLSQFVFHYTEVNLDPRIYMAIVAFPLIFLNWIRNLKWLAPVSLVGNALLMLSISVVFYYSFQGLPAIDSVPVFGTWAGMPLFFGTAIYSFEGITLVLPLQKDMKRPQDFSGTTGLLNKGMFVVLCLYFSVGFVGYWHYGEHIQSSITLNLPPDEIVAELIKLVMVISICSSYAMQFYVPIPILWPTISKHFGFIGNEVVAECVFRTILVILISGLAVAIPKLDLFISLVGAFGCSFLGLIFPPMISLAVYWPEVSWPILIKNLIIIAIGLVGFVTGTYASIEAIVAAF